MGMSEKGVLTLVARSPTRNTGIQNSHGTRSATLNASVNPGGSVVKAQFQFGQTTSYGQVTPEVRVGPATKAQSFSQSISGLPNNTTFHFRVFVQTDFGSFHGADQQFTTLP